MSFGQITFDILKNEHSKLKLSLGFKSILLNHLVIYMEC